MRSLQARVFALVAATFSTIYITQPILPVLREEFGIGAAPWFPCAPRRRISLYILFYYLGGSAGITACGYAHHLAGWNGVVALVGSLLIVPFAAGLHEARAERCRIQNPS